MSALPRKILLAAFLLAVGVLHAGDYDFNVNMVTGADAEIKLTVPGGQMPQAGFLPLRVRINNRNTSERIWRLELGTGSMVGYGMGVELSFASSFSVPGASTREFFIFVPMPAASSFRPAQIQGTLAGPQVKRGEFGLHLNSGWGVTNAPLAIEPALETTLGTLLTARASATPGRAGRMPIHRPASSLIQNVSVIDPALWPADWRLWSSFATVLLDHATWERLDSTRRRALLDWVAMGGRLVRFNSPTAARDPHGAGLVITRVGAMSSDARDSGDFLPGEFNRQGIPPGRLVNLGFWHLSPVDWQLVGRHRWLTGYIIVFGLAVGPLNLFYLAPAGRRHRLFLTVPALSITAALLLFGIITLSDGFGGAGTRRALVLLQPEQNQAVLFQRQISRTGLLAGRKFALPADAIFNLDSDEKAGAGASQQLWREGDEASGDWFTSRATQQHSLRRLVPTRERVELVSPPGSDPVVQSTVGGTLRDFLFIDLSGRMWSAAEVPPGTRVTLVASPDKLRPGITDLVGQFTPSAQLARGSFYAFGGTGGLITTLPSIRWRDDQVLYTGRLGPVTEARP